MAAKALLRLTEDTETDDSGEDDLTRRALARMGRRND